MKVKKEQKIRRNTHLWAYQIIIMYELKVNILQLS